MIMYFHYEVFRKGGYIRLKNYNYLRTIFTWNDRKKNFRQQKAKLFTTCNNCKSKSQLTMVTNKIRVKTTTVRSSNMSYFIDTGLITMQGAGRYVRNVQFLRAIYEWVYIPVRA